MRRPPRTGPLQLCRRGSRLAAARPRPRRRGVATRPSGRTPEGTSARRGDSPSDARPVPRRRGWRLGRADARPLAASLPGNDPARARRSWRVTAALHAGGRAGILRAAELPAPATRETPRPTTPLCPTTPGGIPIRLLVDTEP